MQKYIKKNVPFILLLSMINILFITFFTFNNKQIYMDELTRLYNTKYSLKVVTTNSNDIIKFLKSEKNYRIFIELENNIKLLINNNNKWDLKLKEGNFFEYNSNEKTTLIGEKLLPYVEKINNDYNLKYKDSYYKVIGLLGEEYSTNVDYLALLYSNTIPLLDEYKIIINADNKKNMEIIKNKLENKFNDITIIEDNEYGLDKMVNSYKFSWLLMISLALIIFFSIVSFLNYWFNKEKKIVVVGKLLGLSNKSLLYLYSKDIFLNIIILNLISIIVSYFFIKEIFYFNIILSSIIIILSFYFILKLFRTYKFTKGW